AVKIKDSTRFQLPPTFQEKYPGYGGSASEAGMFIQFEFDLRSGTVSTIKPTGAKRQDSTDAGETVSAINEGELIIRDLGYYSGKVLERIDTERKAFFITRKSYGSKLYRHQNGKFTELELEKELKAMRSAGIVCKEVEVYLNKKQTTPFRLIIEVLPDIEVERRIRKARENRQRKGKQLSKEYRL
ncbi:MAG TPA: transposase, partial [Flavitalea sp.]|nr:transposase [Flavitalea sp.]